MQGVVISTIPFPRMTWRDSSPLVVLFGGNRNYKHVPWDSKGPFQPINEILRDIRLLARMERNYQYVPPESGGIVASPRVGCSGKYQTRW
jgi:hypothetical protein